MRFINRKEELEYLEKKWAKKAPQLVILYGKRRVGKTEIIKHFIGGKNAIYFLADKRPEREQLKVIARELGEHFNDDFLVTKGFSDWYEMFKYIQSKKDKHLIMVIDEFPYLAENNKAISSIFQKGWDEYLKSISVFLILCGSSIGMMELETLAQKSPLYGRRTGQLMIKPFSFFNAWGFFPQKKFEEFLRIYSIVGGVPTYLLQIDPKRSMEKDILDNVFNRDSFLYREIDFILREEIREPRNYLSILRAIALNRRRFSEIINETGLQKNVIHKYLHVLEDLYFIEKEMPVTEKNPVKSKKGLYRLQDQFFKFWFTYIYPYKSELELGNYKPAISKWKKSFEILVAENYETISMEILRKYQDKFFSFQRVGRWWEKNEEIDLVALNEEENKILFGEVKWSNKPVGVNIYEDLKKKAQRVEWGRRTREEYFCLFSKSGFTPNMLKVAKTEGVFAFDKGGLLF